MFLKKINIKNFKSIKDSWDIVFSDKLFVLAWQNESWKSAILEAMQMFSDEEFNRDTLNFEEEQKSNLKQEVSYTYQVNDTDDFATKLYGKLKTEFKIIHEKFLDIEKVKKIKDFTLSKIWDYNDESLKYILNFWSLWLLKGSINSDEVIETKEDWSKVKVKKSFIDFEDENIKYKVLEIISWLCWDILLFNDFSDLLPDKILISDLESNNTEVKWYNAVRNLEKLLTKNFVNISKLNNSQKNSTTSKEVDSISVTFQKDWKQKVYWENFVKIRFNIENDNVWWQAIPTVFFYVETKDNVLLEPRKRSKGMIWFLSAWLELKARENSKSLVILFDEPWLYLHIKAHKDILWVFQYLTGKGHQIIYSTHSPSLIDTEHLHNIWLVINTEKEWTLVEWLTSSKIDTTNKEDALQPIAEAMWLEPIKDFSILSRKNVLLEWLSDFWYLQWILKLLNEQVDFKLVPWIWIKSNKINHLISFCIWYWLDWLLVMDNWENPKITRNELKESIFNDDEDETNKKIKLINSEEIEDLFTVADICLIDPKIKAADKRSPSKIIWEKRKIIFSKNFFQKVSNWEIKKEDLDPKTIQRFADIYSWIVDNFK